MAKNIIDIQDLFQRQKERSILMREEGIGPRLAKLKKLADWIETNRSRIHKALQNDLGRPPAETDIFDIYPVLTETRHAIKKLKQWTRPRRVRTPLSLFPGRSEIHRVPHGVCLILSPWNFPFNLSLNPLVSGIAAGNCLILKPSELSPASSTLMAELCADLFPDDEVAAVCGNDSLAKSLVRLPFDHIFFTGSTAVSREIRKSTIDRLTPLTLELGGKCPAVIDRSADLSDTVRKLTWGKFSNCGQTCVSPDYVLIHESLHKEFLNRLKQEIKRQFDRRSTGFDTSSDYARIINKKHFSRLMSMINQALKRGARIEAGGGMDAGERYIEPLILTGVNEKMKVMQEEIFGPILPVISYASRREVSEKLAEISPPLAAYLFSTDRTYNESFLRQTRSGSICLNDCVAYWANPALPFGGVGLSGSGRSHGEAGFRAFSNELSVFRQSTIWSLPLLIFPPYIRRTKKLIEMLIKYL